MAGTVATVNVVNGTEPKQVQEKIICVADIERIGSAKLPKVVREFYNDGAEDQQTIRENSSALKKYRLRTRVLVDVSQCDTSVEVFGHRIAFPLSAAPAGVAAIAHPDGELATSRACATVGVNMAISSFANHDLTSIVKAGTSISPTIAHTIQLYMMRNKPLQEQIILTAESAGCKAIFLTADSPVLGVRYNERRNDFRTPSGLEFPILGMTTQKLQSSRHDSMFTQFNDDSHSWVRDIPWLRARTKMEIWIKGVLTAEDVEMAIEHGCDGVIVSNHGGRQLDGVPATIDALPECVEAARGRIPIHVDGGFRNGADVFKAMALGAQCCYIGRPVLWGLAYDGQAGVELVLRTMHEEFKRCMQLTGCNSVKDITKASLSRIDADGMLRRV